MTMEARSLLPIVLILLWSREATGQGQTLQEDPLSYFFARGYGQVEVGGRYAGVEFHGSRPLPSRISFYYPVANSIDLSTDYWRREESRPMVVGMHVGDGPRRWVGKGPWAYTLQPHRVTFTGDEEGLRCSMVYEFCFQEPALVFTFTLRNTMQRPSTVEIYTHLRTTLRACQSYARSDSSWSAYDATRDAIVVHSSRPETDRASIVVLNAGIRSAGWTADASELGVVDSGGSEWIPGKRLLPQRVLDETRQGSTVAAFLYRHEIPPGDSISIIQIIGSTRQDEVQELVARLQSSWRHELEAYDAFVRRKALEESSIVTGDWWVDRAAVWSLAILGTNAHYLRDSIVPMPCPAEYNFFFTHDALLTNLAAVHVDLPRVKKDLLYLSSLAKDRVLPHAYYWKDDGFKTEYCAPDNWNHLWFVLATASYLRHSGDVQTVVSLYPILSKSVQQALQQRRENNLMAGASPDWWDIGAHEGPRAYLTILTIRALREFLYISCAAGIYGEPLSEYEEVADRMQQALNERLWDEGARTLTSFNGGMQEYHTYMGSLLGVFFGFLNPERALQLVQTASRVLVDERIGVRVATPPDFHTDSVRAFFGFAGNEAGNPYLYLNGGVWPHANAFYTAALLSVGKTEEARRFFTTTMTLDGIANSPMGQPALYEYRFSDSTSPEFGKIDKPSFLWAGGFTLWTLYRLMGVVDNEWNVSLGGESPIAFRQVSFQTMYGGRKSVAIRAHGRDLVRFAANGTVVPSCVLPADIMPTSSWELEFGTASAPYLDRVNAILQTARFDTALSMLHLHVSSFPGHRVVARVVGLSVPRSVTVDGTPVVSESAYRKDGQGVVTEICFKGSAAQQRIAIAY